jgi:hypothetical protein
VLCCQCVQATAADYGAYAVEFKQAQAEFHRKHASKKKYLFLGPALAIGQAVVFISQFSAIGTLANAKVRHVVLTQLLG